MSYNNLILIFVFCIIGGTTEQNSEATINITEYIFNTTDEKQTTISLEADKIYILDFWYLECAPCVKDHKVIADYIENSEQKEIEVIGISIDKSKKKWTEYLQTHHYNWSNYNQFGFDKMLHKDLKIQLFPTYLVVNNKGELLHKSNRFNSALNFIESL